MNFSDREIKRYNRQLILPELGFEGQQKLKKASVLMIGAGGLGCPVLQYLAAAGLGKIGIIDNDVVDESNLHRQILYHFNDIGKNKALIAGEKIKKQNPFVKTETFQTRLIQTNASEIIKDYDVVIDGSDNFSTRYLVNDICVEHHKPWVFGSIFKFEGQVSVFNYQDGPVYRDLYPDAPAKDTVPNCAEIGVIGILPGIIGLFMANEAIKLICKIGTSLSGRLLVYDALESSINTYKIKIPEKPRANKQIKHVMSENVTNEIDLDTLNQWKEKEDFTLLDVREEWEFEDFNIGGINIPLNLLPMKLDTLSSAKKIVCCCNYGNKSKIAAKLIAESNPEIKVFSLKDGIGDEY